MNPKLAPIKAGIFPLVKKDEKLVSVAKEIYDSLKKENNVYYDVAGSVGRRYARQDENGTPFCFTIDNQSLEDETITIRDRDSGEQKRIKKDDVKNILRDLISGEKNFGEL